MPEKPTILQTHFTSILGQLPPGLQTLCDDARCIELGKNEVLLSEGERWEDLWLVERGCLRLYYLDREGQFSNKNFYLEGALFWPITPVLANEPVGFWVEAVEESVVRAVPWRRWQQAAASFPAWNALERNVLAILLQDKMRREQQFLQYSATQRYQWLLKAQPKWIERIPLRHLASYLGVTDVALSRIRRKIREP